MSVQPRPELLASVEWLAENLEQPETRVVDVRWRRDGAGAAVFGAGHIPGATHVDWATELGEQEEDGAYLLASPDLIARTLGLAGVGTGSTVVFYDDTAAFYAARAWWSLRAFGLESVMILDGGIGAWTAAGRELSNATQPPTPAIFVPRAQPRVRVTTADVHGLLGSSDVLLVDARPMADYRGFEGNARRLGHIPGAVNFSVASTTAPGTGAFWPIEALRKLFTRAGLTGSRRLICYDGSGIGAAKLAFALALAGFEDVAVYDGGWAEWGNRLDLPVER